MPTRMRSLVLLASIETVMGCQSPDAMDTLPAEGGDQTSGPKATVENRSEQKPPDCASGRVSREWLFSPSLAPIPPGPVNRRNSATRVHRLRDRIVRVEIAHSVTHRYLFEFDTAAIEALREVPEWPPLQLRSKSRPAGGPDWPVVFLIYVEGEELPYLGHPLYNELYFAEDDDPWHWYVWDDDGGFRDIHPIPFGSRVYDELEDELGRPDPGGKLEAEAKNEEDIRCGRARPTAPERPSPFPDIPRATVEPAN